MAKEYKIDEMDAKIQEIKEAAMEIEKLGGDIEAVKKNLVRLRASTKMLELNISDAKLVMYQDSRILQPFGAKPPIHAW